MLHDVKDVDTSTIVLEGQLPLPTILAPVGGPRLFHHDGDLAVARAAGRAQVPDAVSTLSTTSLERVARAAAGPLWYQLYLWGDRGTSKELIDRAKAAGYAALIVTVDCTVRSKRERELRAGLKLPTPNLTMLSPTRLGHHRARHATSMGRTPRNGDDFCPHGRSWAQVFVPMSGGVDQLE